jgi:hypothetical protein
MLLPSLSTLIESLQEGVDEFNPNPDAINNTYATTAPRRSLSAVLVMRKPGPKLKN